MRYPVVGPVLAAQAAQQVSHGPSGSTRIRLSSPTLALADPALPGGPAPAGTKARQ